MRSAGIIVPAEAFAHKSTKEPCSIATNRTDDSRNDAPSSPVGAESVGLSRPAPNWSLPQPRKTPTVEFFRIFVKAIHSLAVVVFAAAAVYLMYCGLTGRRDVWMVTALVAVAIETAVYLGFGVKCPLTMLARWLGDDGGHDYLFEWLLGRERIGLVSRSLGLLAAVGVTLILVGSFTPILP